MKKSGIYKITNIETGKIYIGSTKCFEIRFREHICNLRNNRHHSRYLQNSYNKHGESAFVFSIIEECPKNMLLERELYYLNTLLKANENDHNFYMLGYNVCRVPNSKLGTKMSNAQKRKLSAIKKGKRPEHLHTKEALLARKGCQIGKVLKKESIIKRQKTRMERGGYFVSDETRKKMSESLKGENHPFFGKKRSPETIEKIRLKKTGQKHSEETKEKMRNSHIKNEVIQFSLDGVFIKEWSGATEVARYFNCSNQVIYSCCSGKKKQIKGFIWRRKKDLEITKSGEYVINVEGGSI